MAVGTTATVVVNFSTVGEFANTESVNNVYYESGERTSWKRGVLR